VSLELQEPKLYKMGWDEFFRAQLSEDERTDFVIARVVEPLRGLSRVACALGEIWAECPDGVGVGDWVLGTPRGAFEKEKRLSVERILDRKTKLSRTAPSGKRFEQILCANADAAFIVVAMTQALHLPGIERALEAATIGGILPAIVLTKADACDNSDEVLSEVNSVAGGTPIHTVSVTNGTGLDELSGYFGMDRLVVLLGASGAGKSTLTNYFIETDAQLVSGTRERDEKGRHTTTARRLHFLPGGGMIVDSPGIRELQLWKEPETPTKTKETKKARAPRRSSRFEEDG